MPGRSPGETPFDFRTAAQIVELLLVRLKDIEQAAGLAKGMMSRYVKPEENKRITPCNLALLLKGLGVLADQQGHPYPLFESLLTLPPRELNHTLSLHTFLLSTAHPFCNGFFRHLGATVRRMSSHETIAAAAEPNADLETVLSCLKQLTPTSYQATFDGGSYILGPDGRVAGAFTPLDDRKEQLRGASVQNRPYFKPACMLEPKDAGYISDVILAKDREAQIVVAAANICRGSGKEVLGIVDVVVDVTQSPLVPWLRVLAEKLRLILSVDWRHPVLIAICDRLDLEVAGHCASPEWGKDVRNELAAVRSQTRLLGGTHGGITRARTMYVCAELDSVPGFVVLVATPLPD